MSAPQGNKFWEARSSHGRKPMFDDPEVLWDAACEYFNWVVDNPLKSAVVYQGKVSDEESPLMRAMTLDGLHLFLGMTDQTWINYREREGFLEVTNAIDKVIRSQKFEGAAAGLLNANIIARDLGLKDASSNEHTGPNGNPLTLLVKEISGNTLEPDD